MRASAAVRRSAPAELARFAPGRKSENTNRGLRGTLSLRVKPPISRFSITLSCEDAAFGDLRDAELDDGVRRLPASSWSL
jgi:hypothetical protein